MSHEVEQDFFGAQDSEARAAFFEELDAQSRRGAFERYLWGGIAASAALAVLVAAAVMGDPEAGEVAPPADLPVATADVVRERPVTAKPAAVAAARAPAPPPLGAALEQEPLAPAPPPVAVPPPVAAKVSDPMVHAPQVDPAAVDSPWLRERLARRAPPTPAALADAESALAQGEYQKTIDLLRDAEDEFAVASLRGRALLELGQDQAALAALEAALEQKPDDPETLVMLGSLLQETEPTRARRHFEAYLRRYPNGRYARELQSVVARL